MIKSEILIPFQHSFSFSSTVFSHGWYDLPPFRIHNSPLSLHYTMSIHKKVVDISLIENKENHLSVTVFSSNRLGATHKNHIRKVARDILRINETFDEFYSAVKPSPHLRWIIRKHAGRLLRAGSLFEDVVKMICTTNCSWALTSIMVTNLCQSLGKQSPSGNFCFPAPEAIADCTENYLRKRIKLGYRAPYILELAQRVATGKLKLESFRDSDIPTEELKQSLLSIKGVGPYAMAHILKLIGRYDYLGIDSWSRKKYADLYHNGRIVSDRTIERRYKTYGKWAGLVFWLEMTKEWYLS